MLIILIRHHCIIFMHVRNVFLPSLVHVYSSLFLFKQLLSRALAPTSKLRMSSLLVPTSELIWSGFVLLCY